MENTLENKQSFFAQYWNWIYEGESVCENIEDIQESYFLELKPLSQITDEDLEEIGFGNIRDKSVEFNFESYEMNWQSSCGNYGTMLLKHFDFLRSKGYALPFLGLSVEDQIEYGWVKLTISTKITEN